MVILVSIFICKVIEDALSTLRIIIISNGKKVFGAILGFVIALIWIFVTGTVIVGLQENPLKIIAFALGSLVGSLTGSIIEEKIALGTNGFIINTCYEKINNIYNSLKKQKYNIIKINDYILYVTAQRKNVSTIISAIYKHDKNAYIITEKIKIYSQKKSL